MSDGLNRVFLLGHLGADPELRFSPSGMAKLQFNIATNSSYKDREGQRRERTDWHKVVLWGKRAEGLAQHLHRGIGLMVEGQLRTSSYEKNGEKRYWTEVVATDIRFTSPKGASASSIVDSLTDPERTSLPPLPDGRRTEQARSLQPALAAP